MAPERVLKLKESKRELLVFAAHWIYWIWGYALQTSWQCSLDLVLTVSSSDRMIVQDITSSLHC